MKRKKFVFDITDLKVYNYVKCKVSNDAGIYRVMAIDGINLRVMLDGARQGTWYSLDKIKPIPLTNDWYSKLNFESKKEYGKYLHTTAKVLSTRHFEKERPFSGYKSDSKSMIIEYVHQLQNLEL